MGKALEFTIKFTQNQKENQFCLIREGIKNSAVSLATYTNSKVKIYYRGWKKFVPFNYLNFFQIQKKAVRVMNFFSEFLEFNFDP